MVNNKTVSNIFSLVDEKRNGLENARVKRFIYSTLEGADDSSLELPYTNNLASVYQAMFYLSVTRKGKGLEGAAKIIEGKIPATEYYKSLGLDSRWISIRSQKTWVPPGLFYFLGDIAEHPVYGIDDLLTVSLPYYKNEIREKVLTRVSKLLTAYNTGSSKDLSGSREIFFSILSDDEKAIIMRENLSAIRGHVSFRAIPGYSEKLRRDLRNKGAATAGKEYSTSIALNSVIHDDEHMVELAKCMFSKEALETKSKSIEINGEKLAVKKLMFKHLKGGSNWWASLEHVLKNGEPVEQLIYTGILNAGTNTACVEFLQAVAAVAVEKDIFNR